MNVSAVLTQLYVLLFVQLTGPYFDVDEGFLLYVQ
jgi:hypothetical protein